MGLPPLDQLVRPRDLPEVRPAHDLPAWAQHLRDELLKWDRVYFDGSATPWLRKADSHELVALETEVLDLPDELLKDAVRQAAEASEPDPPRSSRLPSRTR